MQAKTFWLYEKIPAPGDDTRIEMDCDMISNLSEELQEISNDLEDPDLEKNPAKFKEEVLKAKKYVTKWKSALPAYLNV